MWEVRWWPMNFSRFLSSSHQETLWLVKFTTVIVVDTIWMRSSVIAALRAELRPAWTDCTFYLPRTPLIITLTTQSWTQTLTYPNTNEKLKLLGKIFTFWNCHPKSLQSVGDGFQIQVAFRLNNQQTSPLCKVTLGMVDVPLQVILFVQKIK